MEKVECGSQPVPAPRCSPGAGGEDALAGLPRARRQRVTWGEEAAARGALPLSAGLGLCPAPPAPPGTGSARLPVLLLPL